MEDVLLFFVFDCILTLIESCLLNHVSSTHGRKPAFITCVDLIIGGALPLNCLKRGPGDPFLLP
jgi:hypothetical protein